MKKNIILLLFLVFSFSLYAKNNPNDVIIKVNNHKIFNHEFIERLNGLPLPGDYLIDEVKENLACTLVAETILANEAVLKHFDTASIYKNMYGQFSKEAMYENWMENEIRKPVRVTDEELKAAYKRFKLEKYVEFYTFQSEEAAKKAKSKMMKGETIDEEPQYKKIEYGKSLKDVEDIIYNLQEGQVSNPILVDNEFYLFKLIKSDPHPQYSKETFPYWIPTIEKIIRDRKENVLLDVKFKALLKDKDFSLNKDTYNFLVSQIKQMLYTDAQLKYSQPEEIQQVMLNSELRGDNNLFNQPLVKFTNGKNWTLNEFWQKLSVSPFPLNYKNPDDLKKGIVDVIRRTILTEAVATDAKTKKYDTTAYVRSQKAMWSNNLLANAMLNDMRNSIEVKNEETLDHFNKNKNKLIKPETRKIIPLVTKDKKSAEAFLQRIKNGEDIYTIAKKYSLNKTGTDKDSTGVFITKDYWGEVGKTAFNMKIGETSGIIKNDEAEYAIIKLLEIHEAAPYTLDEVKDKINAFLTDVKLQKKVNQLLLEKVKNYKISIRKDLVKEALYLGGNMAVKKTHFPLRNMVPSIQLFDHNAKWYKEIVSK